MYQYTQSGSIKRTSDGAFIPIDETLQDYRDVQEWIEQGNTVEPYAQPEADRKAELIAQIAALDLKRIRPMAEGDTIFLGRLTMQIKALRDELKGL